MEVPDFAIPSNSDQLLRSQPGYYCVKKVFNVRDVKDFITDSLPILRDKESGFVLDHFDELFSILVHGSNLQLSVHILGFERVYKCLDMFVGELEREFDKNKEPSLAEKQRCVTIAKMLAYLLRQLVRHVDAAVTEENTQHQAKRKKTSSQANWHEQVDMTLVLLYHWVNLPLEKLWQPPIPDASFVMCVADICYGILERCKGAKEKPLRESIFQILGVLVKRYNHSMSCVVKVVQLVKMCDGLASYLATGVVQLIEETQCTGIVKEIFREVDRATPEEGGTRNIGNFLEAIASSKPELILPAVSSLTDHLDNECYLMRNCAIGIVGIILKEVLTGEDLPEEKKLKRDECLANLMDHMLDSNAYVRSKTLQVCQYLCSEGSVPLINQNALLESVILRLDDKGAIVRKHAFQLLRTLLQCNPFAGKFNDDELKAKLTEAKQQLKIIKIGVASLSKPGAKIRADMWQALVQGIPEVISNIPREEYEKQADENTIDLESGFERIRQQLLLKEIDSALETLIRINSKLPESPRLADKTAEEREEYLISILHKIFMESEELESVQNDQDETDRQKQMEKELQKRKEKYDSQAAVVEYVKNCSIFAKELAKAVPKAEALLASATASDAIEACSFLVIAHQFGVEGAKGAVREALYQVFHPDASVGENLAEMYKQLYIGDDERYSSERQRALVIVKALVGILKHLKPGESAALKKLIAIWREREVVGPEVLQIMWEIFSQKLPGATPEDSRCALMLLTMAATEEPKILTDNYDVLLAVGLGPRSQTDLLLARDTCRAMTKVQVQPADPMECPSRLANDNETFVRLSALLVEKFLDANESCYTTFSTEAINAIYHLADQPDAIMRNLLRELTESFRPASNGASKKKTMSPSSLAKLFHIVGHTAIRELVHLDMFTYKELKRRNTLIEMAKEKRKGNPSNASIRRLGISTIHENETDTPSSASRMRRMKDTSTTEDNGEEALEGATADDVDAEVIFNVLEHEIVTGNGLLAKFAPLVLLVCQRPEMYADEDLQMAATLALSKMMTVSSVFCREGLQLLITIMERSPYASNRANILVGLTDLMNRFPNEVEPWTKHIYGRLRDDSPHVRRTCVKMLSNLIMREMVRVRGQVSELAVCLIDPAENIRQETTDFFNELANKGNNLYNIMPDILSRLTDPNLHLEEDNFKHIIKFILGLLQKEKQVDSIIEKICIRFKLATGERQWRDLAYCLSLLKFNSKSVRRLSDNLILMKDAIHHGPVLKVLQSIIEQAKKKPETKGACAELEEKLEKMLTGKDDDQMAKPSTESVVMPPPATLPRPKRTRKTRSRSAASDE